MKTILATLALAAPLFAFAASGAKTAAPDKKAKAEETKLPPGLYAIFITDKGKIVCRLFEDKAPKTVANFTGLAQGTKEWTDPMTGQKKKTKFYDGLKFMRVIPGFMIQGGDPLNDCTGGPGFKFEDEFSPELKFDKPGLLAMANSGPNTNGSQFFITDKPRGYFNSLPTHLTNHHTIFGEVVEGLDVVSAIADMPVKNDLAVKTAVIEKLEILRVKKEVPAKK